MDCFPSKNAFGPPKFMLPWKGNCFGIGSMPFNAGPKSRKAVKQDISARNLLLC